MKPRSICLFVLVVFTFAFAGAKAVEDDATDSGAVRRVLDALDRAGEKLEDVTARLQYTREIALLEEREECKGSLRYRKPNLIHVRLREPRNEEFYTNGKLWWVVRHDDPQVEIYEAAESGDTVAEASFLCLAYDADSKDLLKRYDITLLDEETDKKGVTRYRLRFVPKQPSEEPAEDSADAEGDTPARSSVDAEEDAPARPSADAEGDTPARPSADAEEDTPARYSAIEVELTDKTWLPQEIVLYEGEDGEIVHTFKLHDVKVNVGLKKESFTYKPPKGYSVIEPGSM